MSLGDELRKKIDKGRADVRKVWEMVLEHRDDYVIALKLEMKDLEELERQKGHIGTYPSVEEELEHAVLKFEIDDLRFGIVVKHVSCADYSSGWHNIVMAGCISDPSINIATGYGTTLVFTLPEGWHKRVMSELTKDAVPPPPSWFPTDKQSS